MAAKPIDPVARVEQLRAERVQLLERLRALEAAPRPLAEAVASVDEVIDSLRENWRADIRNQLRELLRTREGTRDRVRAIIARWYLDWESAFEQVLPGLLGNELKAAFASELAREHAQAARETGCLADDARAQQLAEARAQLRSIELEEERLIVESELRDRRPILRRDDCDPAILFSPEVLPLEDQFAA